MGQAYATGGTKNRTCARCNIEAVCVESRYTRPVRTLTHGMEHRARVLGLEIFLGRHTDRLALTCTHAAGSALYMPSCLACM